MASVKCPRDSKPRVALHAGAEVGILDALGHVGVRKYECCHGHELVVVRASCNGRRAHFRHKHADDVHAAHTSAWHLAWQDEFVHREVPHPLLPGGVKERRADVLVPAATPGGVSLAVEMQHSYIREQEVRERGVDYTLHGREVLWVLDARGRADVVPRGDSAFIITLDAPWMWKSFPSQEYVYINTDGEGVERGEGVEGVVYRVAPSSVQSGCAVAREGVPVATFIAALKEQRHASLWGPSMPQPTRDVRLMQFGAGNGKTYALVRSIASQQFNHIETFIFLTKVHPARSFILSELRKQAPELQALGIDMSPDPVAHLTSQVITWARDVPRFV